MRRRRDPFDSRIVVIPTIPMRPSTKASPENRAATGLCFASNASATRNLPVLSNGFSQHEEPPAERRRFRGSCAGREAVAWASNSIDRTHARGRGWRRAGTGDRGNSPEIDEIRGRGGSQRRRTSGRINAPLCARTSPRDGRIWAKSIRESTQSRWVRDRSNKQRPRSSAEAGRIRCSRRPPNVRTASGTSESQQFGTRGLRFTIRFAIGTGSGGRSRTGTQSWNR